MKVSAGGDEGAFAALQVMTTTSKGFCFDLSRVFELYFSFILCIGARRGASIHAVKGGGANDGAGGGGGRLGQQTETPKSFGN